MHVRDLRPEDLERPTPVYAVWEVTLRCDHACGHCGSRAAKARPDELSTDELVEVADALIRLGSREVTLIGGEAYLRPDLDTLVRHLAQAGLQVSMQTGGYGLTAARARALADAGMRAVGVSIDGPAEAHDVLRGRRGSHDAAVRAIDAARDAGMVVSTNMQLNQLSLPHLRDHFETLYALQVAAWRTQITVPMGRAADRPEWLLQPWQILEALDELAELQHEAVRRVVAAGLPPRRAMYVHGSNNVGYYGPVEELLRSKPGGASNYWTGCPAGRWVVSIESDGTVKACPSLPTAPYDAGNVRDPGGLESIWRGDDGPIAFDRAQATDHLWGFCQGCYYAAACRGGCNWSSHVTLGKRGNQPWCYHRAATLKKRGLRERLERVQAPQGVPYDFGRFELIEESWPDPGDPTAR